jgi:hypothetical protein
MHSLDPVRSRARRVPLLTIAVAALLAVSAWTAPPRPESPRFPARGSWLGGVSAVSRTDAWAVGYYYSNKVSELTLAEHWNGSSWRQVPSPSPGGTGGFSQLTSVSAISANDAWAVGSDGRSAGSGCLIEHWDGSRWAAVTAPGGLADCRLTGVTALSAGDAWAVGEYFRAVPWHTTGATLTLIEHWNGAAWRQVASPDPAGHAAGNLNYLYGVAAASPRDAWAVGSCNRHIDGNPWLTLIEHWNGTRWATVHSPSPGLPDASSAAYGVAARAASVWAVGDDAGPFALRPAHGQWGQVVVPGTDKDGKTLAAVAVTSASSAWAVGGHGQGQPWTVHWNGKSWSSARAPYPAGYAYVSLDAVTAPSAAATWAVGSFSHTFYTSTALIEHWTGTKWVIARSANP